MDSTFLWAPKTSTNEPRGENLCARHVSSGDSAWDLISQGFIEKYDQIFLDMPYQMVVLAVLSYSPWLLFSETLFCRKRFCA